MINRKMRHIIKDWVRLENQCIMRISFLQTGGLGGVRKACNLDPAELSKAESAQLLAMVRHSGLLRYDAIEEPSEGKDVFHYEIRIQEAGQWHQARFDDLSMPSNFRPLCDFLRGKAVNAK